MRTVSDKHLAMHVQQTYDHILKNITESTINLNTSRYRTSTLEKRQVKSGIRKYII